jgi:hypothetical protein
MSGPVSLTVPERLHVRGKGWRWPVFQKHRIHHITERQAESTAKSRPTAGGRAWWAHLKFTCINITPTILRKKIEDLREAGASSSIVLRAGLTVL